MRKRSKFLRYAGAGDDGLRGCYGTCRLSHRRGLSSRVRPQSIQDAVRNDTPVEADKRVCVPAQTLIPLEDTSTASLHRT